MRIKPNTLPARLLEMASDHFGALEAVTYSSIKLARHRAEPELSMDLLVASAVLEFAPRVSSKPASTCTLGTDNRIAT